MNHASGAEGAIHYSDDEPRFQRRVCRCSRFLRRYPAAAGASRRKTLLGGDAERDTRDAYAPQSRAHLDSSRCHRRIERPPARRQFEPGANRPSPAHTNHTSSAEGAIYSNTPLVRR